MLDLNLLTEFLNFDPDPNRGAKAQRIWNKCMRAKHFKIADKIKLKYGRHFPKSDLAIAFMWGEVARQKNNEDGQAN